MEAQGREAADVCSGQVTAEEVQEGLRVHRCPYQSNVHGTQLENPVRN
jgi:hypothetical protein